MQAWPDAHWDIEAPASWLARAATPVSVPATKTAVATKDLILSIRFLP